MEPEYCKRVPQYMGGETTGDLGSVSDSLDSALDRSRGKGESVMQCEVMLKQQPKVVGEGYHPQFGALSIRTALAHNPYCTLLPLNITSSKVGKLRYPEASFK